MEEWREVTRNSNYSISESGRIRRNGAKKDHSMRDRKGYFVTDLYNDGRRTTEGVHILVAEAFIPNPQGKPEVNHEDGDKHNNHVSNLRWVTKKENCEHARQTGLAKPSYSMRGRKNPNAGRKGKPFKIVETGEVFKTLEECESATGCTSSRISDCLRGVHKKHKGYHFEYI